MAEWLLRAGLAFSFAYPAVDAWFDPFAWLGYFPASLIAAAGTHQLVLLHAFGAFELLLALWVLLGARVRVPALVMAAMLILIVACNLAQMQVLFRDLAIALAAVALAYWPQTGARA